MESSTDRASADGAVASPRPATSADVGKAAGVSRSTVSLVLNDVAGQSIPEATRERVRAAAAQLGYVPNRQAAALRRGRTDTVLIPSPPGRLGTLVAAWIDEVEAALESRGYTVLLYGDRNDRGARAIRRWIEMRPLVVLTLGGRDLGDDMIAALHRGGIRTVIMTDDRPRLGAHVFHVDHAAIGDVALSHLGARGRRRIGLIAPRDDMLVPIADRRWAHAADDPDIDRIETVYADLEERDAARIARAVSDHRLDGIAAFNDDFAMLALAGLTDAGIRVPDDVAIVGADNQPQSALSRPAITSIGTSLPLPEDILGLLDPTATPGAESFLPLPPPQLIARATA